MNEELKLIAQKMAVDILYECGVKCLLKDIESHFNPKKNIYFCHIFKNKNKKLKDSLVMDKLLDYISVRPTKERIVFEFSPDEVIGYKEGRTSEGRRKIETEEKLDEIMSKIEKCLSLANSPNENEAQSAIAMAQRLMVKYDISYEDINGEDTEEITEASIEVGAGNSWKMQLAQVVADNYRCYLYLRSNIQLRFRGHKGNTVIARRVFTYLYETCLRLGKSEQKRYKEENGTTEGILTSFAIGFTHGCSQILNENSKALVIITEPSDDVKADWKEFSSDMKIQKQRSFSINGDAYDKGVTEGRNAVRGQYIEE